MADVNTTEAERLEVERLEIDRLEIERLGSRIDTLETRLTFQDDTIEALNSTITAQWKQIDALTRQVALLGERLQEAENNASGAANEAPPHY